MYKSSNFHPILKYFFQKLVFQGNRSWPRPPQIHWAMVFCSMQLMTLVKDKQKSILVRVASKDFDQQYSTAIENRIQGKTELNFNFYKDNWILKAEWGNEKGVEQGLSRVKEMKSYKKGKEGVGPGENHLVLLTGAYGS